MNQQFIELLKDFYFPLADLILKVVIGIVITLFIARKGFKYKIKERLYDNYLQLAKLMSEAIRHHEHILEQLLLTDLLTYKSDDDQWLEKYGKAFLSRLDKDPNNQMKGVIEKIREITEEIYLYIPNYDIQSEFRKIEQYLLPFDQTYFLRKELRRLYDETILPEFESATTAIAASPNSSHEVIERKMKYFFMIGRSSFRHFMIQKTPDRDPYQFLQKVKKKISKF